VTILSIEMLTPERVTELWPVLEPYFSAACESNEIAKDEMSVKDIYLLAVTGLVAIFVGFENNKPACAIGIQFNMTNGRKCADVIAMAGRGLLRFKAAYWHIILEWLKSNEVRYLDAYVPERHTKLYLHRFGFNKSCAYVRMAL